MKTENSCHVDYNEMVASYMAILENVTRHLEYCVGSGEIPPVIN